MIDNARSRDPTALGAPLDTSLDAAAVDRHPGRSRPSVLLLTAPLDAPGGIARYGRGLVEALAAGTDLEVVELPTGRGRSRLRQLSRALGACARTRADLVVLSHLSFSPFSALLRLRGVPTVVLAYGIDVWGPTSARARLGTRAVTRVWPISSFTAEQVRRHYPGVTVAAPLGGRIDPHFFDDPVGDRPDRPFTVLVVCRLDDLARKGIDTTIEAARRLAADRPVEVRIVGGGAAEAELPDLIRRLDAEHCTTVVGRIDDDTLRTEYRGADVLVLLSRFREGRDPQGEGLGLVILEAAAAGVPSIGSAVGGSTATIVPGTTGILLEPADADILADQLRILADDPSLVRRLGTAARAWTAEVHGTDAFDRRVLGAVAEALG